MEKFAVLLLLMIPAYFIYAVYATLRAARQRRDEAAKGFGAFQEHPQEDWESLQAQYALQEGGYPHCVDDITWNDLDMNLVFHRINACLTTPGEEELYNRLRSLRGVEDDWEGALAVLDRDSPLRLKIQTLLAHVGKNSENGLPDLLRHPDEYRLPYAVLFRAAAFLPLIAAALFFLPVPAGTGFVALLPALLLNAGLYYWGTKKLQGRLHTVHYAKALLWCAKKLTRMPMPGLEANQDAIRAAARPFARLRGAFSAAAQDGIAAGDAAAIMMFIQVFFLTELKAYNKVMSVISKHAEELGALYRAVGRLDMMISVLSLRKSLSTCCLPRFHEQMSLQAEDVVHPLLKNAVENSVSFDRGVLLTGSNASGKSTFIKAMAVNAIFAQSINTCSAAAFSLPRAKVISSMALRDNLSGGESYFVVEIKSFRRILQAVKHAPCLCFVDEILRGTNTIERIAASSAVLKSLQQGSSLCIAATHDIELTKILSDQYDNYHFKEELKDKGVQFDYKLRPGPSQTRNALLLLGAYDFPEKVIQEAEATVKFFERERRWPSPASLEGGSPLAPA